MSKSADKNFVLRRYALALGAVLLATLLRLALDPLLHDALPYVTFYVTLAAVAWFGGLGPSLLCLVLGFVAGDLLFVPPRYEFAVADTVQAIGYVIVGATIVSFGLATRRARRQAQLGRDQLAQELTERGAMEDSLRISEERYRLLFESPRDAIFLVKDGRFVECNPAATAMFGCPKEDIVGQTPLRFSPARQPDGGDSAERAQEEMHAALSGQPRFFQWRHRRLDGTEFDGEVSLIRLFERGALFLQAIVRDITDRRRAEEALRESEAFRKHVFEASRIPIVVMDAATSKFTDCNMAAVQIYGFPSREHVLGKTPVDVSAPVQYDGTPSPEKARYYIECAKSQGSVVFEWRHQRPDGEIWDAEVHLASFRSDHHQLLQFTLHDITERKRAKEALQQAHDELERRVAERTDELSQTVEALQSEVMRRTTAEQVVREQFEKMRAMALDLTLAEGRERERLARLLHDGLQQLLVGARLRTAKIEQVHDPATSKVAREVSELLNDSIVASRHLTAELSPPVLREGGLVAALEWLVRWMQDKHELTVHLDAQGEIGRIDETTTVLLFQATRELLFNVVKHAGVKSAHVQVTRLEGSLQITVADEGAALIRRISSLPAASPEGSDCSASVNASSCSAAGWRSTAPPAGAAASRW